MRVRGWCCSSGRSVGEAARHLEAEEVTWMSDETENVQMNRTYRVTYLHDSACIRINCDTHKDSWLAKTSKKLYALLQTECESRVLVLKVFNIETNCQCLELDRTCVDFTFNFEVQQKCRGQHLQPCLLHLIVMQLQRWTQSEAFGFALIELNILLYSYLRYSNNHFTDCSTKWKTAVSPDLLVFLPLVTFPLFLLFFFSFSFGVGLFFFFCSKFFQQLKNPPTPLFTNHIKARIKPLNQTGFYLLRGLFSKNEGRTSIFFIWVVWKCSCSIAKTSKMQTWN